MGGDLQINQGLWKSGGLHTDQNVGPQSCSPTNTDEVSRKLIFPMGLSHLKKTKQAHFRKISQTIVPSYHRRVAWKKCVHPGWMNESFLRRDQEWLSRYTPNALNDFYITWRNVTTKLGRNPVTNEIAQNRDGQLVCLREGMWYFIPSANQTWQ